MARALAQEPEILLLDEPTSNLDLKHQLEVMDLVKKQTKDGVSALVSIHDFNLAARYSDKIVMLKSGEISTAGKVEEVPTPETIEPVYDVKVSVRNDSENLVIIPEESRP